MIKYAIIILDDSSVSFCHYESGSEHKLMTKETLQKAIKWSMKENLNIQFVYSNNALPEDYESVIESVDHTKIKPSESDTGADVIVIDGMNGFDDIELKKCVYILHTSKQELFDNYKKFVNLLPEITRLNVVIVDIDSFNDKDFDAYSEILNYIAAKIESFLMDGKQVQLNIITDRMHLEAMNNCNAGKESITIAPNGKFYICPAFYYNDPEDSEGDLDNGLNIRNGHLYDIGKSAICRICDSYHCKRCVWLNRKTTLEVLTPSRQQCIVSHLERNASKKLLESLQKKRGYLLDKEIKEIDYLDPFEKIEI